MHVTEFTQPDWARAFGPALGRGELRVVHDDFRVDEILPFEPTGEGGHDYLLVEKRGHNTAWVADALARFAGVGQSEVGYAGLKDRNAVTTQWFSVPRRKGAAGDWRDWSLDGTRIVQRVRHGRKLKRGVHRANRFRIVVRMDEVPEDALLARAESVRRSGVPNYFGAQRFGIGGSNLRRAESLFCGARLRRQQRGLALSAARSLIFNEVLQERVAAGNWNALLAGDWVNLDGSNSGFATESVDRELVARCSELDVHPTGPLWGRGETPTSGEVRNLEFACAARHRMMADGLEQSGVSADRRPLRCRAADLEIETESDRFVLTFTLRRGSYATSVIREFVDAVDAPSANSADETAERSDPD